MKQVFLDRGYKGQKDDGHTTVHIDWARQGRIGKRLWKAMKHQVAIEPIIGLLKGEHRLNRNRLGGVEGDTLNPPPECGGLQL